MQDFRQIGGRSGHRGPRRNVCTDAVAGEVGASHLDGHGKGAPHTFSALDARSPAVKLHPLLHQGETDPCAFVGTRLGALNAVNPIEQMRHADHPFISSVGGPRSIQKLANCLD